MNDREHAELILLYQVSVADIAFFKQQQWLITSYAVGVYVALVTVVTELLPEPVSNWQRGVATVLALGAVILAGTVLSRLDRSIKVRRDRLARVREHFQSKFKDAWQTDKDKDQDQVTPVLATVIGAGAMLAVWIMCGW